MARRKTAGCGTATPIYDTVLFVGKLLEQYFAQRTELKQLRAATPMAPSVARQTGTLAFPPDEKRELDVFF